MGCPLCLKHRGEGPLVGPVVYADHLVLVSHRAAGSLGYLYVDSRRHVPSLDGLSDEEAEAVGRITVRLARALRRELDVEAVHTATAGLGVAHFHQHVFVRHVGTPAAYDWWQQWPGAPVGDVHELSRRLARQLAPPPGPPAPGRDEG